MVNGSIDLLRRWRGEESEERNQWAWALRAQFDKSRHSLMVFVNCREDSIEKIKEGESVGTRGYKVAVA